MKDGILKRKWRPRTSSDEWDVSQIVIPVGYRPQILSVAHDGLAGHLGINKTYSRILRHFFWPGLKQDVAQFCKSCHVCQVGGKPNQTISPAPLYPIPVICEPFEHVLIDIVGPLPRSRHGHQYLLTIMCAATRFPEAVPLRNITAKTVVRGLTKFFSVFGLPKIIQSDQGLNCRTYSHRSFSSSILGTMFPARIIHRVRGPWNSSKIDVVHLLS